MKSKFCLACNNEIIRKPNDHNSRWEKRKFCSSKCCNSRPNKGQFKEGHPRIKNSGNFKKGNKPHNYKGEDVGYLALHSWVSRHLGKPKKCEHCCNVILESRKIHWANKSGLYKRDLSDWIRLCAKCHLRYDWSIGFRTNMFKQLWQKTK